jgi:hypothetical protein
MVILVRAVHVQEVLRGDTEGRATGFMFMMAEASGQGQPRTYCRQKMTPQGSLIVIEEGLHRMSGSMTLMLHRAAGRDGGSMPLRLQRGGGSMPAGYIEQKSVRAWEQTSAQLWRMHLHVCMLRHLCIFVKG